MSRKKYTTDLTDKEWNIIEPMIPKEKPGGRPREQNMREIINAIIYILRAGCAWNLLTHDFQNIKPCIIISENGASMGHGNGFMAQYESVCEKRQDGITYLPQGS